MVVVEVYIFVVTLCAVHHLSIFLGEGFRVVDFLFLRIFTRRGIGVAVVFRLDFVIGRAAELVDSSATAENPIFFFVISKLNLIVLVHFE